MKFPIFGKIVDYNFQPPTSWNMMGSGEYFMGNIWDGEYPWNMMVHVTGYLPDISRKYVEY